MIKLIALFILAMTVNVALSGTTRYKRQTNSNDEELDDRYGFERPQWDQRPRPGKQGGRFPGQGGQFPGQGDQFPGQGGQFPGQGGQFPGQGGQFPGQGGQLPGQGGQFPGQGGQFPGQGGQFPGQGGQFPGQGGQFPGQGGQFPGQGGQLPGQGGNGNQGQQNPNGNAPTTQSPSAQQCMRNCPVTAEYNPVCGDDNVTYSNPGRLSCAQSCGLNVNLLRSAPCPTTTTVAPS